MTVQVEVEAAPVPNLSKSRTVLLSASAEIGFATMAIVAAILANSVTLWTNAARVTLESASCILAYYAVWKSSRISVESFNYGLGKLENLVSLFTSVVIFTTFLIVGWNTIERLREPVEVHGVGFGLVSLLIALSFNAWLFSRFWRLKKRDSSPVIDSLFVIYRNAVIATGISLAAVLLGVLFREQEWAKYLDPAGALILGGFLLKGAVYLMRRSIAPLLDGALEESAQIEITSQLVAHFDDYEQLQRIRTRRSGSAVFIEVFLEFDRTLAHGDVVERMSRIRASLEKQVPGAEVNIVPV